MSGPTPYILFPGTAREVLTFYGEVFGCAVQLHTFAEFNRADGPADAIAQRMTTLLGLPRGISGYRHNGCSAVPTPGGRLEAGDRRLPWLAGGQWAA